MEDNFDKLRTLLKDSKYPSVYLFKFIVKKDEEKILQIKQCFNESAEIQLHPSKKGNYVSVSVKEMMLNAETIIERYKEVGKIEHVITL